MTEFSLMTPLVQTLPATVPFVGPEAIERQRGARVLARIGANESGFGPAPSVIEAMRRHAPEIWQYNDPENDALKQALAAHLGVSAAHIGIGEGIDGLLGLIVRLVIAGGESVVTSLGAYPTFNYHVAGFGGRLVTAPYAGDREDLNGLLDLARREHARLVYLANPDNPMGSWWEADDVVAFARALPETSLLILDEAYCETGPASARPALADLLDQPNVIRTRTFSKAYGLAGARVGYTISTPGNAAAFDRIRHHFGMNRLATEAALAALKDQAYLSDVTGRIAAARDRIGVIARRNGLEPLVSATNFVAIDAGGDGVRARAVVDGLMSHGVFIRMPGVAPLNRCIRVSTGPEEAMDRFEEALPKVLATL